AELGDRQGTLGRIVASRVEEHDDGWSSDEEVAEGQQLAELVLQDKLGYIHRRGLGHIDGPARMPTARGGLDPRVVLDCRHGFVELGRRARTRLLCSQLPQAWKRPFPRLAQPANRADHLRHGRGRLTLGTVTAVTIEA